MKRIPFLRRPITHNFKRPHSKTEKPDPATAGFRRNLPSFIITTHPPRGRGYMRGWNELQQITKTTDCLLNRQDHCHRKVNEKGVSAEELKPLGVSIITSPNLENAPQDE